MHKVSIAAEKITDLFGVFPLTNTLLTGWIVMLLLILWAFLSSRKMQETPTGLQNFTEAFVEIFWGITENILGSAKKTAESFALVTTIFLFVIASNWFGLLPGVGAITVQEKEEFASAEHTATPAEEPKISAQTEKDTNGHAAVFPLLRATSSDLSFTLALALCAVIYVQILGFRYLKWHYLSKFFNFKSIIFFFVGILELISEFAKMISFSFRLFGNVFAGEVLLVVMTFLVPVIIPVPFYGLEVFVGMVQAGVFAALTMVFIKGATAHH